MSENRAATGPYAQYPPLLPVPEGHHRWFSIMTISWVNHSGGNSTITDATTFDYPIEEPPSEVDLYFQAKRSAFAVAQEVCPTDLGLIPPVAVLFYSVVRMREELS